jgi:hypothetical protein
MSGEKQGKETGFWKRAAIVGLIGAAAIALF